MSTTPQPPPGPQPPEGPPHPIEPPPLVAPPQPVDPPPPQRGSFPALMSVPVTRFDGLPPDSPPRPLQPKPPVQFNPFLRFFTFLALLLGTSLLIVIPATFFVPLRVLAAPGSPIATLVQILTTLIAYLVLVLAVEARRPPVELSLRRSIGLPVGLLAGAVLFLAAFALIYLLGGFRFEAAGPVDWPSWWNYVLMVGAGAGISEEILFRGVAFRFLEELLGSWVAVALSGLIFGLVHISNPDATWLGAIAIALEAGLFFAVLYALTRSLWIVMGVHATWNLVQGPVLGIVVSGSGEFPSLLNAVPRGSDLISGGTFGAEASLVTVVFMLAVTAVLAVQLVRRGQVVAPMWVRRRRQRAWLAERAAEPVV